MPMRYPVPAGRAAQPAALVPTRTTPSRADRLRPAPSRKPGIGSP